MAENSMLVTAVYTDVDHAIADLHALSVLHTERVVGDYDAAVITQTNGEPHIVKRADRPKIHVIPEVFGSGALPRKELHEAATELASGQAGLVVICEPTLEEGLDQAITRANQVVKRSFDAGADELADELSAALKSGDKSG
jgi:hypothetical protein